MRRMFAVVATVAVGLAGLGLFAHTPAGAKVVTQKLTGSVSDASMTVSKTDTTSKKNHTLIDGSGVLSLTGVAQGSVSFFFHSDVLKAKAHGTIAAVFAGTIAGRTGTLVLQGTIAGLLPNGGSIKMPLKVMSVTGDFAGTTGTMKIVGGIPSSIGPAAVTGTLRMPPPPLTTTTKAWTTTTTRQPVIVDDPAIDMISVDPSGAAADYPGSALQYGSKISESGRYVAFASNATNLVAGDTNGAIDTFVRDRATNTTQRVSVNSDGSEAAVLDASRGNYAGAYPAISADGRYVVFTSAARLVRADHDGALDLYRYDRTTQSVALVSVSVGGTGSDTHDPFYGASISTDGRYVAFQSDATNLVTGDTDPPPDQYWTKARRYDVFLRDMVSGTTTLLSADTDGLGASADAPAITPDGQYVVYHGSENILPGGAWAPLAAGVLRYNRLTGTTEEVSLDAAGGVVDGWAPSVSDDGNVVAFLASGAVTPDTPTSAAPAAQVYARDITAGTTTLVSIDGRRMSDGREPQQPAISADGRYVAFWCWCQRDPDGLTGGMGNPGVYRVDRTAGAVIEVDANARGVVGDGDAYSTGHGTITADGSSIVFVSQADNLVTNDDNGQEDVFVTTPE